MGNERWTATRTVLHVVVGLGAGLLSGLFGVGGGVVIVPALVLLLRYDQRRAAGTSLAAIVPTASVGVIAYAVAGNVDWAVAFILAAGAVVGAQVGSWLLPRLPVPALQIGFTAFLVAAAVSLFVVIPSRDQGIQLTILSGIALGVLGLLTGVLSGLLGVGGGIIVVPALILLFGSSDLIARGTSLLMMIPAALSGTTGNIRRKNVDLVGAALIGGAACLTTTAGAWIARSIDPFLGNILFAVFLAVIAVQLVARAVARLRKP